MDVRSLAPARLRVTSLLEVNCEEDHTVEPGAPQEEARALQRRALGRVEEVSREEPDAPHNSLRCAEPELLTQCILEPHQGTRMFWKCHPMGMGQLARSPFNAWPLP